MVGCPYRITVGLYTPPQLSPWGRRMRCSGPPRSPFPVARSSHKSLAPPFPPPPTHPPCGPPACMLYAVPSPGGCPLGVALPGAVVNTTQSVTTCTYSLDVGLGYFASAYFANTTLLPTETGSGVGSCGFNHRLSPSRTLQHFSFDHHLNTAATVCRSRCSLRVRRSVHQRP